MIRFIKDYWFSVLIGVAFGGALLFCSILAILQGTPGTDAWISYNKCIKTDEYAFVEIPQEGKPSKLIPLAPYVQVEYLCSDGFKQVRQLAK